jgi:dTMP kinase
MKGSTAPTGRFIVLDGPDGSGKSTQARLLVEWLDIAGRDALHLRDPGGTRVGEKVRGILLDPAHTEMDPWAEALLFMASRAQLAAERISPALAAGRVVVCERWVSATVCYQGYAGGIAPEAILSVGRQAMRAIEPDLTLVLDVDPSRGLARIARPRDLLEGRPLTFHEKVRAGFLRLAADGILNARVIEEGDVETVRERIRAAVRDVL